MALTLNRSKTTPRLLCYNLSYGKKKLTATEDNDSKKQRHVTVIQLQRVELNGKLKLWFHHLTERLPETLKELPCHEDLPVGDKGPVLVHQRCHHDD